MGVQKGVILTFENIVLEILDIVSKLFVFCWISNFTELKAFILLVEFLNYRIGNESSIS